MLLEHFFYHKAWTVSYKVLKCGKQEKNALGKILRNKNFYIISGMKSTPHLLKILMIFIGQLFENGFSKISNTCERVKHVLRQSLWTFALNFCIASGYICWYNSDNAPKFSLPKRDLNIFIIFCPLGPVPLGTSPKRPARPAQKDTDINQTYPNRFHLTIFHYIKSSDV